MAIPSWTMVHRMGEGRSGWNRGKNIKNVIGQEHQKTAKRYRDRRAQDAREFVALGILDPDSEIARRYVDG